VSPLLVLFFVFVQAELTLARSRDLGSNDVQFRALTHLGNILSAGDIVMGYDMSSAVYNDADTKGQPPLCAIKLLVYAALSY